jgi:hypothetical protein
MTTASEEYDGRQQAIVDIARLQAAIGHVHQEVGLSILGNRRGVLKGVLAFMSF